MKSIKIILTFVVLSSIALLQAIISVGIRINKEDNDLQLTFPESFNILKKSDVTAQFENPGFIVPEYKFPTIDERFEYYMGDWYNVTDWQLKSCKGLRKLDASTTTSDKFNAFDSDMIVSLETLTLFKPLHPYCSDAYDILKQAKNSDPSHLLAIRFGDSFPKSKTFPVISKSKPALDNYNAPSHIIWPLNMRRHYGPVEQLRQAKMNNNELEWEDKESKVFWRGITTGRRYNQLKRWIHYDPNIIDIAFDRVIRNRFLGGDLVMKVGEQGRGKKRFLGSYLDEHSTRPRVDLLAMSKYKYLLSVEGNDVSTGLKWMLYSNSVVFMAPPTKTSWAMEDLLLPFVHYVPLADDYSNLMEMIAWAEDHQEACKVISKRATDFIDKLWVSEQAKIDTEILRERLATAYVSQFQKELSQCSETNLHPDESFNLQRGGQSDRKVLSNATLNIKESNSYDNIGLDFAVIGFPRCGTTFLLKQLQEHKDVTMSKGDYCQLHNVRSGAERVSSWLTDISNSSDTNKTKYGIKCSTMVRDMSGVENLMKISDHTRLVVGVRHPVKWFESFYNYRVLGTYNNNANDNVLESHIIPNPRELLNGTKHWKGVSTASARFDAYLKQLAKVPLDENERKTMFDETLWPKRVSPNPYKVFIYTVEQLHDENEIRQVQFQTDLQHHLGLSSPFRDFNKASKANSAHNTQWYKEQIDICEPQYAQIRKKLVQQGRISSEWIINRFIESNDVAVSDKDYFTTLLRTWGNDPCQFPTNKEGDSAPRIAWLMSFPNSGTSYTKHLVDVVSGYNTASNYIEQTMRSNDFIWDELSNGPFYSASPSTYNDKNWTISPTGFVLTKTHCGSYCFWCTSEHYISSAALFSRSCGLTDQGYYSITLAKRAVHMIRDPLSNIVARFHLDYEAKLRQQNETNIFTRDENGFRKMCSELDSSENIATSPFYRDVGHLVKVIPCSSDFFRYVQWHNLAHITTLNLDIPTLIIHYENYTHNFNQTVDKLHNFLQLDMKNPPPLFVTGKTYREYFTREERTAVKEMVKILATKKTWENVHHYFQ